MQTASIWIAALFAPPVLNAAYTVPYTITPTQEEYNECAIEECEKNDEGETVGDGSIMTYDNTENAFKHLMSKNGMDSDDYIWFPAVALEKGSYKLTFEYKTKSDKENFSIVLATEPKSEKIADTLKAWEDISNEQYTTETIPFEITAPGEYNLGIHVYSLRGKWNSWYRNFSLTKIDDSAPKVPGMTLEADGLDVTVTLTFPSQTVGGDDLTGNVTGEIYVDGELKATVDGAPGASVPKVVKFTSGRHLVSALVKSGGKTSESVSANIHTVRKCPVPMTVPLSMALDEDEFIWSTVINVAEDMGAWEYCETGMPDPQGPAIRYNQSWSDDADDWFILPVIEMDKGAYEVAVDMATKYQNEVFEICFGTEPTPESLSQNVVAVFDKNLQNTWERVKARMTVAAKGRYYIALHATSPKNRTYLYLRNLTVDAIDGSAPANPVVEASFDGGNGTITVKLPSTNIAADELTVQKLKATVTIDGDEAGAKSAEGAPGTDVVFDYADLEKGMHTAVATVGFERDGASVNSEPVTITFKVGLPSTFAYDLPLSLTLDKTMEGDLIFLDANDDGYTFKATDDGIEYSYSSSLNADDWVFTAPVNIDDVSKLINFSIEAKTKSNNESFEIWIGDAASPESMTQKVIEKTDYNNSDSYAPVSTEVMLAQPGKYVVGIHCVSAKGMWVLYLRNLMVVMTDKSSPVPAEPTGLTAVAAVTGELNADISFTLPTVNVGGEELDSGETLTATVISAVETKTVSGLPGDDVQVNIATSEGENTIRVTVANSAGTGKEAQTTVKCGLDKPVTPKDLAMEMADDNLSARLTWTPVTEGQTGGPANPDGMFYIVWEWDENDADWYQIDAIDGTEYTYEFDTDLYPSGLSEAVIGIQAFNGKNSGSDIAYVSAVFGTPYTLPMEEGFAGGRFTYSPITLGSTLAADYRPEWSLGNPADIVSTAACDDRSALIGTTTWSRGDSYVILPKFSTEDMEAVSFEAMIYVYPNTPKFSLVSRDAAGAFHDVATFDVAGLQPGWHPFTVALGSDLLGRKWNELAMFADFATGSSNKALIDGYRICDPADLSVGTVGASSRVGIRAVASGVNVTGAEGETLYVYTTDGRLVRSFRVTSASATFMLEPGTYLVNAGDASVVVLVR